MGKSYRRSGRRTTAFRDLDLTVAEGELVCLLGPSGCGKSTLLNVLAGILPYEEGVAEVSGRRITGPSAERGMLFQSPMLFPWLTARQNVVFGPKAQSRRGSRSVITDKEVDDLLAIVGLSGFEQAYPKELSGGMQHRVAFARAVISRPSVLLMDEPFASLDALTRERMQEFLLEMRARFRITIIFVTHDIEEAIRLGDRVCVMGGQPPGICADINVQLGRPRTQEDLDSRETLEVKRQIRAALHPVRHGPPNGTPAPDTDELRQVRHDGTR